MKPHINGDIELSKDWEPEKKLTMLPPSSFGLRSNTQAQMTGLTAYKKKPKKASVVGCVAGRLIFRQAASIFPDTAILNFLHLLIRHCLIYKSMMGGAAAFA
jgi:hypothetical protein